VYSYEFDRMSNPGNGRNYRESSYQQQQQQPSQRGDNYNNQQGRRSSNYSTGNGNSRGRRGAGGNSYRGGTQSDVGTGGKFRTRSIFVSFCSMLNTDEASECGDAASSTMSIGRKYRDWHTQVDSEQQQEGGYNTDSLINAATLPRGAGGRGGGGRRGWKRGRPPLPHREGVHQI